jgi:hypothetical protein
MVLIQRQHTTVVCRGGGLNKYQHTAADGGAAVVLSPVAQVPVGGGFAPAAEFAR